MDGNKNYYIYDALHLGHKHNVEHASPNYGIGFTPSIRNQVENVSLVMFHLEVSARGGFNVSSACHKIR